MRWNCDLCAEYTECDPKDPSNESNNLINQLNLFGEMFCFGPFKVTSEHIIYNHLSDACPFHSHRKILLRRTDTKKNRRIWYDFFFFSLLKWIREFNKRPFFGLSKKSPHNVNIVRFNCILWSCGAKHEIRDTSFTHSKCTSYNMKHLYVKTNWRPPPSSLSSSIGLSPIQ